jgi:hypothetical protein
MLESLFLILICAPYFQTINDLSREPQVALLYLSCSLSSTTLPQAISMRMYSTTVPISIFNIPFLLIVISNHDRMLLPRCQKYCIDIDRDTEIDT